MSYPNVIYGDFGDEKVAQSAKIGTLPLGQLMILPDGRVFRHAQANSAAALVAGALVGAIAGEAGHGAVSASGLLASATTTYNTIGAITVHVACTKAVATLDQYADGFLNVQKSAGLGHVYRIKSNKSAASTGADLEIELYPEDPLVVAWAAGSTAVSLRKSPYTDATIWSTSAAVAPPIGIVPVAVSASFFFWAQRGGVASVRQSATAITDGTPVVCSSVTSGSVMPATSAYTVANLWGSFPIGVALETATGSDCALVDLTLE